MHPGSIIALLLLGVLAAVVGLMVGIVRLLFRLADRGGRSAVQSLGLATRSLFGPGGPPEDLAKNLRERYPELTKGVRSGLAFSCMGRPGRLDFITDLTEIRFDLGERSTIHLEVSTPSFLARVAEDDPDAFRVRGDEELYRRLFKESGFGKMFRSWGVAFEWIVRPGEFFLQLRALPQYEEELWRWLKGAFALLQALPGIGGETALPVARVTPAALAAGLCQICGSTLGQGTVVYCVGCSTPHHQDCWAYVGECSTFACRERRYAL